uniref:cleavage stimulation factor subunit 2-like n=1 Tax=Podarcis muralis TaxID=64176 RepID=UPI0010A01E21|nr:cleavage stimulation factor subunit 2-like [Podarcis muralis]
MPIAAAEQVAGMPGASEQAASQPEGFSPGQDEGEHLDTDDAECIEQFLNMTDEELANFHSEEWLSTFEMKDDTPNGSDSAMGDQSG